MRWSVVVLLAGCGRLGFSEQSTTSDAATPVTTSTYPMAVLESGPHTYYRLSESTSIAVDASGNGHDARIEHQNGGTVDRVAGALAGDPDTALRITGTGNETEPTGEAYIDTPDADPLWAHDWTTEEFVRVDIAPTTRSYGLVVCEDYNNGVTGDGNGFRTGVGDVNGTVLRWWNDEANGNLSINSDQLQPGQWIHFVVTKDDAGVTLYLDGAKNVFYPVVNYLAPTGPDAECGIGAFHGMPSYVSIDEVALYERALTPDEITKHFAASRP